MSSVPLYRRASSSSRQLAAIGLALAALALVGVCTVGTSRPAGLQAAVRPSARTAGAVRCPTSSHVGAVARMPFAANTMRTATAVRAEAQTSILREPEIRVDSPLKIEAVLFDLDGTLLDFEGGSHDALNKVLEPYNSTGKAKLTWEMHGTIVGRRASEWSSEILEQCGITPDVLAPEKYVEMYLEKMPEYYPSMPLMPGALNLVKSLKAAGYKVAVASSSEKISIEKKLKFHPELLQLMDIVQPGDDPDIKAGKPAPDIFLAAAKKLGVKPENCLVFEDSPFGLMGAKAGNMACVAIPDGRMPIADSSRFGTADFLLNSMEEFKMDYIEKI